MPSIRTPGTLGGDGVSGLDSVGGEVGGGGLVWAGGWECWVLELEVEVGVEVGGVAMGG